MDNTGEVVMDTPLRGLSVYSWLEPEDYSMISKMEELLAKKPHTFAELIRAAFGKAAYIGTPQKSDSGVRGWTGTFKYDDEWCPMGHIPKEMMNTSKIYFLGSDNMAPIKKTHKTFYGTPEFNRRKHGIRALVGYIMSTNGVVEDPLKVRDLLMNQMMKHWCYGEGGLW